MSQWAAGWYPDPDGGGQVRYWDGTAWTEHRQPAQGVGATESSAAPGTPSGGSGSKALLLVAAVTLVVLALLCAIGVFAFRAMGGGGSPSSSSTTSATGSTSPTSPSSPPSSSPTPSSSSPAPSGPTTNVTSVIKAKVGTTYLGNGNGAIIVPAGGEAGLVEAEFLGKGGPSDRPDLSSFRVSGEDSKGVRSNDYSVFSWYGPAKGTGAYNLVGAGATHRLKIESDGQWSITFRDLEDAPKLTDSATGTGDEVLAWDGKASDIRVSYTSASKYGGSIRISAVGAEDYPDRLVSEYEKSWEGTTTVQSGTTYLIVGAQTGNWEISRR